MGQDDSSNPMWAELPGWAPLDEDGELAAPDPLDGWPVAVPPASRLLPVMIVMDTGNGTREAGYHYPPPPRVRVIRRARTLPAWCRPGMIGPFINPGSTRAYWLPADETYWHGNPWADDAELLRARYLGVLWARACWQTRRLSWVLMRLWLAAAWLAALLLRAAPPAPAGLGSLAGCADLAGADPPARGRVRITPPVGPPARAARWVIVPLAA